MRRFVHVVRREEDRRARVAQALHHRPDLPARRRVEARRGLVEEEHPRIADEPETDIQATLLGAGEVPHARVFLAAQADRLDGGIHTTR